MEVPPSEVSLRAESLRVTRNFRVAGPYTGDGADGSSASPNRSTNDGVVVAGELSGFDFGSELHTILLWVQTLDTFGA
jgi:hypothetical protein